MSAAAPAPSPPRVPKERAVPEVYRSSFQYVWHLLRRLGVEERHLEDGAHEVFLVVYRRWDSYDPGRPLRPWLAGIAVRVASDLRRRASHRREQVEGDVERLQRPPSGPPAAERVVEAREARALVSAALAALRPERREVFVLHEIEGHSIPDLVEPLGVPLNTLYSRLRLARADFATAVRQLSPGAARRGSP